MAAYKWNERGTETENGKERNGKREKRKGREREWGGGLRHPHLGNSTISPLAAGGQHSTSLCLQVRHL